MFVFFAHSYVPLAQRIDTERTYSLAYLALYSISRLVQVKAPTVVRKTLLCSKVLQKFH